MILVQWPLTRLTLNKSQESLRDAQCSVWIIPTTHFEQKFTDSFAKIKINLQTECEIKVLFRILQLFIVKDEKWIKDFV